MFISHKYRAIFVHIQRTGGNSIQRVFEEHDPDLIEAVPIAAEKLRTKHCYLSDIAEAIPADIFRSYCKFAVVRNPFDRLLSWYTHLAGQPNAEDAGILFRRDGAPDLTSQLADLAQRHESIGEQVRAAVGQLSRNFSEFLRIPASAANGLFARFYVNQVDYLTVGGALAMDHILRFETLPADFERLAQAIGFAGRLPHRNRSTRANDHANDYANDYDVETQKLVAVRCQPDCAAFGYRFEGTRP